MLNFKNEHNTQYIFTTFVLNYNIKENNIMLRIDC